jgi:hypothetical protein
VLDTAPELADAWPFAARAGGAPPGFAIFYRWLARDPRTSTTPFLQCDPFFALLVACDYALHGAVRAPAPGGFKALLDARERAYSCLGMRGAQGQ